MNLNFLVVLLVYPVFATVGGAPVNAVVVTDVDVVQSSPQFVKFEPDPTVPPQTTQGAGTR